MMSVSLELVLLASQLLSGSSRCVRSNITYLCYMGKYSPAVSICCCNEGEKAEPYARCRSVRKLMGTSVSALWKREQKSVRLLSHSACAHLPDDAP